jgi:hypothetical protein
MRFRRCWLIGGFAVLVMSLADLVGGCGGGSITAPASTTSPTAPSTPPTTAAAPAITSVTPASVPTGSTAFTLQVNGSGFVSGSVVYWNKSQLTTTFVSSQELQAAVPANFAATGGNNTIMVANPDGQTTGTSGPQVAIQNPVPAITKLSPSSAVAGSASLEVMVTGTGFLQGSVAAFSGSPRVTTVESATQLMVTLTAADLVTAAQASVTVTNPAPGGGVSPAVAFSVTPGPPTITAITPESITAPAAATQITILGSGFTPQPVVWMQQQMFTPDSVTANKILVTVPSYLLLEPAVIDVSVLSSGIFSNVVELSVVNPLPVIQSISNSTVVAGSPGFGVTIQATGFVQNTQINVNGVPLASPFAAVNNVVRIPTSALAQVGTITFSLTNPGPGGGTSNSVTMHVIAGNNYLRTVNLTANALVWNPKQQVIYAAVAASSATNGSSITAIDPTTGNIVASQPMPAEPSLLAISDDQQYLYVGMTSTAVIVRLKLPDLSTDIQWTVGPTPAPNYLVSLYAMQTAPGAAHTLAVTQETPAQGGAAELAIYDDGVMRPNTGNATIQPSGYTNVFTWGADAYTIYATEDTESGGPEFVYSVNAQGVSLANTLYGALGSFSNELIYDSNEARLYDTSGSVVDASTGKALGSFGMGSNTFTIDTAQHLVYLLGGTYYPNGVNILEENGNAEIYIYDQDRFTLLNTIVLPEVSYAPGPAVDAPAMIRWGTAGLAFNSDASIYILDGPVVTPGATPTSDSGNYVEPPPQLAGLSPESVVAGSPDVALTLTGQNFTPATSVSWSNYTLATTYVSNTQVQVVIPAADLTTAIAAPLYVSNSPGEGISNILEFSVLPNLGSGVQLTALNLSGSDLVWNAANQMLYAAITSGDSLRPQTLVTVDPVAGAVTSTLPLSANPYNLAISVDDTYLYVGFANNANIQRFALPGLTPDLSIPLGIGDLPDPQGITVAPGSVQSCDFEVSMAIAPGSDTTLAVTQGSALIEPLGCGATAVIDGAIPRPTAPIAFTGSGNDFSHLAWGADATALFAQGDDCCTWQPISSLTVSSAGVVLNQVNRNDIYLGYRLHFDAGTNLLYSDGGAVTAPSTLAQVGNFNASGLVVPDSTHGVAYFLGTTLSQSGGNYTLQIFDLRTYALLKSIVLGSIVGFPNQMIRWGSSGIAFITENGGYLGQSAPGMTYILSGDALAVTGSQPVAASEEHVQFTWRSQLHKKR